MSLAMLTSSGWVWAALTMACTLEFVVSLCSGPRGRRIAATQVYILAAQWAWLAWLMTP